MTPSNHAPGIDFEEWFSLCNRIIRMRRLGHAALRDRRYKEAWDYYHTARRAQKRIRELEQDQDPQ